MRNHQLCIHTVRSTINSHKSLLPNNEMLLTFPDAYQNKWFDSYLPNFETYSSIEIVHSFIMPFPLD